MEAFDRIWDRESALVAAGEGSVDVGPGLGVVTVPPIITMVCRLSSTRVEALRTDIAAAISRFPGHYLYPPGTVHVTLLNLQPWISDPGALTVDLLDAMADVWSSAAPITLGLRGVGMFRTTIFGQLHDPHGRFTRLRNDVAQRLSDKLQAVPKAPNQAVFCNVVRFLEQPQVGLPAAIEPLRDNDYGRVTLRTAEVVVTDKFLSPQATRVVHSFEANDRASSG